MKNAPSIKDAEPAKKTDVKLYKGLGYAPVINKDSSRTKPMGESYKDVYQEGALEDVKADIEKQYGKGAIVDTSKPKQKKEKPMPEAKPRVRVVPQGNPYKPRMGESD